ncbi:hypothetical protein B0H11DRAFT_2262776 [Mycena galericulata]|nr:hypothetical protein B0H11DRAFT_2262776 [Mycena galericulata]
MAALDSSSDYDDAEIVALIASLDLADLGLADAENPRAPSPPPRTPSPRLPSHNHPTAHISHTKRPDFATRYTTEWSMAGSATQGVTDGRVFAVSPKRKNKKSKKSAYVVFCGSRFGVFHSWAEVKPLVTGFSNSVFRGYNTVAEAQAAFQYALSRGWVRNGYSTVTAISTLPTPASDLLGDNPLNGLEPHNSTWYVVYRGITPGVYRSHLESQLNTLGVRGALYESIEGKHVALEKYAAACSRGEVAAILPPYPADVFS